METNRTRLRVLPAYESIATDEPNPNLIPMNLEHFISVYGYAAIVTGTILEGETVLLIAAVIAGNGGLSLLLVIVSASVGSVSGDLFFYQIGRVYGVKALEHRKSWKKKSEKIFHLLHKHQTPVIMGFRFIYGIRAVTPIIIGASGIRLIRFIILDTISACLWSVTISLIGYNLGYTILSVFRHIKHYESLLIGLLLVTILAIILIRRIRSCRS